MNEEMKEKKILRLALMLTWNHVVHACDDDGSDSSFLLDNFGSSRGCAFEPCFVVTYSILIISHDQRNET